MERVELLAPSGSMESLIAAINRGADAIYLGGDKFSARAYASNFDKETMEKAVDYAHLYGVKVYVTINTLIKENEINEALDYVSFLYKIGVDALIIQDVGVLQRIKEEYDDFEIHASTQMTVHNGDGALFFHEQGFKRIVLSRELTFEEIKYISKDLGIETEIFIHGALCIAYSGQCLMSSMIGGRSGNRGRCAQSCRLPYTLINENTNEETKGYLLSPKDICTIEDVEELVESGTGSLKIEGRMKRPEYVAGVVESYNKALSEVYAKRKPQVEESKRVLMKLFNREGFSKAYLYKNVGKDMMAYKTPKNSGVFIGEVDKNGEVTLLDNISLKDGIRIGEEGFPISKLIVNNVDAVTANKGEKVKIFPKKYKKGDKLYQMSDNILLDTLKVAYKNPYERKIALNAKVNFKVGEELTIHVNYNGKTYSVTGEVVQTALKKPLDKEKLEENLKKSGDIPYKIENLEFINFEDGFLPVSSINNLRRDLFLKIVEHETSKYKRVNCSYIKPVNINKKTCEIPEIMVSVFTKDQLRAAIDKKVEAVILNIWGKNKNDLNEEDFKLTLNSGVKTYIYIPSIVKEEYNYICKFIDNNIDKIEGIVTANTGLIYKYRGRTKLIGDYKLNIFNSSGLKFYMQSIDIANLSLELNRKEIKKLMSNTEYTAQYTVYGKVEAMISEYCPIGSTFGGRDSKNNCSAPCRNNSFKLIDRMNERLTVKTDKFCRSHIYNAVALNLIKEMSELKEMGIKSFKLDFIDETYEEVIDVLSSLNGETLKTSKVFTKGHYKRGVE
ncbi:putative protease [Clostridium cavendishii DSM 21758]|uniref:Putative protease n=1 Tax=Clostridium cavendishii DSM 21758 TaxID=1121302 RepID=A0A1M6KSQ1_9CLOT|nr:U32 family peptidase [Clostridium cavendishii]SHJ61910.1 putative protease [Clostridium cavendishii DSM 21758]